MGHPDQSAIKRSAFLFLKRITLDEVPEDSLTRTAYRFWRGLSVEPALPARTDFKPENVPRDVLPWLFLMDVIRAPDGTLDYCYRLNGTGNVSLVGRDPTRRLASKVFEKNDRRFMLDSFDRTVEEKTPTFWAGAIPHDRIEQINIWRGLFPLASDRENVDQLLGIAVPRPSEMKA
ncbi:PAS domain-containing protein [Nisaea denitrificans]|uniref:PAS domain-containing protein n=1 Tax=Nisaea denitrificans TaxID=390877 RepID=UPI000408D3A7|nr:PAS domain-containing protein [Nisaea denitrificans]